MQASEQNVSPDPTTRKENTKNSKKDAKKKADKTKKQAAKKEPTPPNPSSGMTNLADLPGLGRPGAGPQFKEEDSGGFDDFDFEEDHIGDSSNKFDEAEK